MVDDNADLWFMTTSVTIYNDTSWDRELWKQSNYKSTYNTFILWELSSENDKNGVSVQ